MNRNPLKGIVLVPFPDYKKYEVVKQTENQHVLPLQPDGIKYGGYVYYLDDNLAKSFVADIKYTVNKYFYDNFIPVILDEMQKVWGVFYPPGSYVEEHDHSTWYKKPAMSIMLAMDTFENDVFVFGKTKYHEQAGVCKIIECSLPYKHSTLPQTKDRTSLICDFSYNFYRG